MEHETTTTCSMERLLPAVQQWTSRETGRGYPIVDNKYFDLATGQVVTLGSDDKWRMAGPPTLDIYWQNRQSTTVEDAFHALVKGSTLDMTDYVIRLGEFLKESGCRLQSLTATTYSINVVIFADMSKQDMHTLQRKHGI